MKRFLRTLERISLAIEKPLARLVRDPRFNPLYHTGTITVFLLLIILVTGVYLTMFYQFGFAGSYRAVANVQASLVGRVIRALHRYASDLAVIFALLHGWRTFFMDRFRGPRWLAWVTGIGLAAITWIIGITGYWLISDTRAQLLNETLVRLLGGMQTGADFLRNFLATDTRGAGWRLTFIMMALHLGLSAVIGLVYWYHIRRLSRPKWLPPRFWLVLVGAPLLLAAIIVPLGYAAAARSPALAGTGEPRCLLPLLFARGAALAAAAPVGRPGDPPGPFCRAPVVAGSSARAAGRSEHGSLYRLHSVRSGLPLQSDHDEAARGGRQIQVSGRGQPEAVRRVRHLHRRM